MPGLLQKRKAHLMIVEVAAKTITAQLDSFVLTSSFKMLLNLVCEHHRLYRRALVPQILLVEFKSFSVPQTGMSRK